jgi:hypothetical protein
MMRSEATREVTVFDPRHDKTWTYVLPLSAPASAILSAVTSDTTAAYRLEIYDAFLGQAGRRLHPSARLWATADEASGDGTLDKKPDGRAGIIMDETIFLSYSSTPPLS